VTIDHAHGLLIHGIVLVNSSTLWTIRG
jgi:hypothetical protein